MAVIIETTTPNITVTSSTSLSDRGRPTCFNPFLAVTKAIMIATKKLYIGINETAAWDGSLLSKINFFALR